MLLLIIATVCLGDVCRDEVVTTSKIDQAVSEQWCANAAMPRLAAWMGDHWPGYRLAGWRCEVGPAGTPV